MPIWSSSDPTGKAGEAVQRSYSKGAIRGLRLTWLAIDQVQIGEGTCRDDADMADLVLSAPVTVDLSQPVGPNSIDAGAPASNTWLFIWLIEGASVPTAGLASLSSSAPTLPAGYSHKRRIGAVRLDAATEILKFLQEGNDAEREYRYLDKVFSRFALIGGAAAAFTPIDCSAIVPPTSLMAIVNGVLVGAATGFFFGLSYASTPGGPEVDISIPASGSSVESFISDVPLYGAQLFDYRIVGGGLSTNALIIGFKEHI